MQKLIISAMFVGATLSPAAAATHHTMTHHHEMLRHHHHMTGHVQANGHCKGMSHGTGYHGCGTATGGPVGGLPSKN
jgi:hypothetical protein